MRLNEASNRKTASRGDSSAGLRAQCDAPSAASGNRRGGAGIARCTCASRGSDRAALSPAGGALGHAASLSDSAGAGLHLVGHARAARPARATAGPDCAAFVHLYSVRERLPDAFLSDGAAADTTRASGTV